MKIWLKSPSTRRAWIEIPSPQVYAQWQAEVALHPEGVDRNIRSNHIPPRLEVALHPEGVDRNNANFERTCLAKCRPPPGGRG